MKETTMQAMGRAPGAGDRSGDASGDPAVGRRRARPGAPLLGLGALNLAGLDSAIAQVVRERAARFGPFSTATVLRGLADDIETEAEFRARPQG